MRIIIATAAIAAATAFSSLPASADTKSCGNAPQAEWMSIADLEARATAMGYKVRQVKIEDGCYEIYALDKNGERVEAYLNPVTAEIVKTKMDD
jgi:hypothetical protein